MSSGAAEFGCRTFKKGIFIFDIIIIWLSLGFNNKLLAHVWKRSGCSDLEIVVPSY